MKAFVLFIFIALSGDIERAMPQVADVGWRAAAREIAIAAHAQLCKAAVCAKGAKDAACQACANIKNAACEFPEHCKKWVVSSANSEPAMPEAALRLDVRAAARDFVIAAEGAKDAASRACAEIKKGVSEFPEHCQKWVVSPFVARTLAAVVAEVATLGLPGILAVPLKASADVIAAHKAIVHADEFISIMKGNKAALYEAEENLFAWIEEEARNAKAQAAQFCEDPKGAASRACAVVKKAASEIPELALKWAVIPIAARQLAAYTVPKILPIVAPSVPGVALVAGPLAVIAAHKAIVHADDFFIPIIKENVPTDFAALYEGAEEKISKFRNAQNRLRIMLDTMQLVFAQTARNAQNRLHRVFNRNSAQ